MNPEFVWLRTQRLTLLEISEASGLEPEVLRELVEFGALMPADAPGTEWTFEADCVPCLRTAARLRSDLELEADALALAFRMLRRIESLEAQLRALRARR